ncbi:MAG TPA: hypothetical protein VH855_27475 [Acetobacteraceae bacterium]
MIDTPNVGSCLERWLLVEEASGFAGACASACETVPVKPTASQKPMALACGNVDLSMVFDIRPIDLVSR